MSSIQAHRSLGVALLLVIAGCGTQVSHDRLVRGAGGGASGSVANSSTASGQGDGGATPTAGGSGDQSSTAGAASGGPSAGAGTGGGVTAGGSAPPVAGGPGSGPAAGAGALATPAGCASANRTPVVIGSVGTYSGALGGNLASVPQALQAWAKYTNANGGVACHPVQLFVDDDQASSDKARSFTQELVETKHAVALVSAFIPNTVSAVQAYVDPHQIPVVGGDGFTPWDHDPMLFNAGSSTDTQVFATEKFSSNNGKRKWAVLYCAESPVCSAGKDVAQQDAAAAGVSIVDAEQVSVAQANFTANCLNARNKGADVLYVISDGSSMFRVSDDCSNQGYHPLIATASASLNNDQPKDPNLEGLFGSNADAPWILGTTPALQAFQSGMSKYAPSVAVSGSDLIAWTSGELFKRAVEGMGASATSGPITTQLVLAGLWNITNETLGGLAPHALSFHKGQPGTLVRCAFITQVHGGKWTAPIGLTEVCRP